MDPNLEQKVYSITRPNSKLALLYFIRSLAGLFAFPIILAPLLCKYISLRYKFEKEGIGASWGVLFHKQVFLTYGRIQDIHVSRGLIERWLGLGTVEIQTAAGNAGAELSIVGVEEVELIRDFLYTKMRGVRGETTHEAVLTEPSAPSEALILLQDIRNELREIRVQMQAREQDHV